MDVIAVDIGNSRIACGLFRQGILVETWHCETDQPRAAAELIAERNGIAVKICSVVPDAAGELKEHLIRLRLDVSQITSQTLVRPTYETLGMDRQANAVAAWKLYGSKAPVAVLDLGTATTLTAVDSAGTFRGG